MSRIGPATIDSDRAYEVAEAFFAELAAHGVRHVVLSPGSRSTPLTIAAHHQQGLRSWVHIDERSAGFFALGMARATRQPVALVCTSGTAAANYLPAVIEAHYSKVPLVVCTADRPPELRQWGAGQTVDQVKLYGDHVRWFADAPVASDTTAAFARRLAARAVASATGPNPGPVHCNWPLREPLPPVRWRPSDKAPQTTVALQRSNGEPSAEQIGRLADLADGFERGLIVVGPTDQPGLREALAAFAAHAQWPIVAEPTSQLRTSDHNVIATGDALVKSGAAQMHRPDVVLRVGLPPTSKAIRLWLEERPPTHHVLIDPAGDLVDPSATCTEVIAADASKLFGGVQALTTSVEASSWLSWWRRADRLGAKALAEAIDNGPCHEPAIVAAIADALPADAVLYVSNSMPVRDVDSFYPARTEPPRTFANRGASGIDGLASCALGVAAATDHSVVLLVGDVAFLHDLGGLFAGVGLGLSLTVVLVDNGGGQIFSFLPIAQQGDDVAFTELFTTPPAFVFDDLNAMTGIDYVSVDSRAALDAQLRRSLGSNGINVIRVVVDADANLAQHRSLTDLVAAAVANTTP